MRSTDASLFSRVISGGLSKATAQTPPAPPPIVAVHRPGMKGPFPESMPDSSVFYDHRQNRYGMFTSSFVGGPSAVRARFDRIHRALLDAGHIYRGPSLDPVVLHGTTLPTEFRIGRSGVMAPLHIYERPRTIGHTVLFHPGSADRPLAGLQIDSHEIGDAILPGETVRMHRGELLQNPPKALLRGFHRPDAQALGMRETHLHDLERRRTDSEFHGPAAAIDDLSRNVHHELRASGYRRAYDLDIPETPHSTGTHERKAYLDKPGHVIWVHRIRRTHPDPSGWSSPHDSLHVLDHRLLSASPRHQPGGGQMAGPPDAPVAEPPRPRPSKPPTAEPEHRQLEIPFPTSVEPIHGSPKLPLNVHPPGLPDHPWRMSPSQYEHHMRQIYSADPAKFVHQDHIGYGEDPPDALYHVTTNRDAVLHDGLKSRSQIGGSMTPGLGGGIRNFAPNRVSVTWHGGKAAEIENGLRLAAEAARNLKPASDILSGIAAHHGMDDYAGPAVQRVLREHGVPDRVTVDPDLRGLDEHLDRLVRGGRAKYELLQQLDDAFHDDHGEFEDQWSPRVGFTAPWEAMRSVDPEQIHTFRVLAHREAKPEEFEAEQELRFLPHELFVPESAPNLHAHAVREARRLWIRVHPDAERIAQGG